MKLELLPRTELTVRLVRTLAQLDSVATAHELAEAVGSSAHYLPHVVRPLVRAGWVTSSRGPNGGYRLVVRDMTVLEVIEAVEGATDTGECVLRNSPCPATSTCALHEAWTDARTALLAQLSQKRVLIDEGELTS